MKNKMRMIARGCSALALVAVMPLAGATIALADDAPKIDENNPAEAAITKELRTPTGVDLPSGGIAYQFTFTAVSLDGKTDQAAQAQVPLPGDAGKVTIPVTDTDQPTEVSGYNVYKAQSDSLFDGTELFSGKTWPKAGVYEYTITENKSAAYTADNSKNEELWYSQAQYTLKVYVENGATAGVLYVKAVTAVLDVTDTGSTSSNDGAKGKVDPAPGDTSKGEFSLLAFTNGYSWLTDPTLPVNPADGYAASVTKMVAGDFADQTRYFDFQVTLNVPPVNQDPAKTYKAYVVNAADGAVETAEANAGTDASVVAATQTDEAHFLFAAGTVTNIKLKHNQRLAFVGLPYTSSLTVRESGSSDYKASLVTKTAGTVDANSAKSCTTGQACDGALPDVGANARDLAYTNTRDQATITTPTGLDLDDAAYWAMVVMAGVALIGFVVIRVRKSKRTEA
ncbi:MAG: hypothetical protein LBD77_01265 [Bifidobacteriaceae bacterium]|nr:hypothetical protein [Bifidobacteriaceae bacterium]